MTGAKLLRTCVVLMAALVLVSCSSEVDKPLAAFKGDGFSVRMPGEPARSAQTDDSPAGKLTTVLYTSESPDRVYIVAYTVIPEGVDMDLPGAINGVAGALQGTPQDEEETSHQGFPARDARITNMKYGDGKGTDFVRVILTEDRLYQLQYIQLGADLESPPPEYPKFLASLKIT